MDPITIGTGAVAIGGAVAGWLNSKDAAAASAAERARMQRLLDQIQEPNFDMSTIKAPEFKLLQKYTPQVSNYVAEANPTLVKGGSDAAKAGRESQMEALRRLREVAAAGGTDIVGKGMIQQAIDRANIANRGNQMAIRENMAARGLGGGGMELAMAAGAQQAAGNQAAMASQQAAMDAYRSKLQALRDSAALGGQIHESEVDLERGNAGIINDFNRRTAANQNTYNQYRDSSYNDAQRYNIGEGQRIHEKNVGGQYERDVNERAYGNDLKQRKFGNSMDKYRAASGISQMARDDIRANAADKANAISGITQGVVGAMNQGNPAPKTPAPAGAALTDTYDDINKTRKRPYQYA